LFSLNTYFQCQWTLITNCSDFRAFC
jgi:hypothetical protein